MTALPFAHSDLFRFDAGRYELGDFTRCSGLEIAVVTETRSEGGINAWDYQFASRLRCGNLTLVRPVTQRSPDLVQWVSEQAQETTPLEADIVSFGPDHRPLVYYHLERVVPVRWIGPVFDTASSGAAMEGVEIAYGRLLGKKA
ncbi:phage tail protein [Streptomyces netropsis]